MKHAKLAFGIALCILVGLGTYQVCTYTAPSTDTAAAQDTATLYAAAMEDAMIAQEDEIFDLVTLTQDDALVTWDAEGRVLLLSYHAYPDSYVAGEDVTLVWGSVWAFTDKELEAIYDAEKDTVTDWTLRLEQLIGLPEGSGYIVITGMWVSLDDIIRPAYQSDATLDSMATTFTAEVDDAYQEWFDDNILDSYYYGAYPWTRLGYTYDWADNGTEYGVTEFLIAQNAEIEVAYTLTVDELWALFDAN